jgi:protein-L-isoaspartate(D-aspartate) O-methyltransferase
MVAEQLAARGIHDERVLAAMGAVPREQFVLERDRRIAYSDRALGIAAGQTISQPWIVAAICQGLELEGEEKVLEIGTGSGYSAAVLERLCERVISIERIEELATTAREALARVGAGRVEVRIADGSLGAADEAPFEAIAVHAALPGPPRTLLGQLAVGGRLVAPVDTGLDEVLTRFRREGGEDGEPSYSREPLASCRFVPLIGEEGYGDS